MSLRDELYLSLPPADRAAIDAARQGRELARLTVEDACALMTASDWVRAVRGATLKAYPRQRAQDLLNAMGDAQKALERNAP